MDIFGLPSVTEVFREKLPDISKEGFGFNFIKAKADIQHGQLTLGDLENPSVTPLAPSAVGSELLGFGWK